MQRINISIASLVAIFDACPNGTSRTTRVEEYTNDNGDTVKTYKLLA